MSLVAHQGGLQLLWLLAWFPLLQVLIQADPFANPRHFVVYRD